MPFDRGDALTCVSSTSITGYACREGSSGKLFCLRILTRRLRKHTANASKATPPVVATRAVVVPTAVASPVVNELSSEFAPLASALSCPGKTPGANGSGGVGGGGVGGGGVGGGGLGSGDGGGGDGGGGGGGDGGDGGGGGGGGEGGGGGGGYGLGDGGGESENANRCPKASSASTMPS